MENRGLFWKLTRGCLPCGEEDRFVRT
uniref:Uncharacterized protein n=1 Tax=Anguilla anguilla TaxID=7936 RepID=A0A0E9UR26_ANGAN